MPNQQSRHWPNSDFRSHCESQEKRPSQIGLYFVFIIVSPADNSSSIGSWRQCVIWDATEAYAWDSLWWRVSCRKKSNCVAVCVNTMRV